MYQNNTVSQTEFLRLKQTLAYILGLMLRSVLENNLGWLNVNVPQ